MVRKSRKRSRCVREAGVRPRCVGESSSVRKVDRLVLVVSRRYWSSEWARSRMERVVGEMH